MTRRYTATTAAALLLVVTMAGCSAGPVPAADPVVAPAPVESAAAEPLPTTRVPLTCDQMGDTGDISALVGAAMIPTTAPAGYLAEGLREFATRQYGQLDCAWSTGPGADPFTSPSVAISVVPGVPTHYWSDTVAMSQGTGETAGGFPGDSFTSCTSGPGGSGCSLRSLIGEYWLSVNFNSLTPGITLDAATPFFAAASAAVSASPAPSARWTAASSGNFAPESGLIDAAALGNALGDTVEGVLCSPTSQAEEHWVAWAETGYSSCTYGVGPTDDPVEYLTVDYLPGGSWALPEARTSPGATDVAGLGSGAFLSRDTSGPRVTFLRGGDLVSVGWYSAGAADPSVEQMTATAGAISSLLP